MGTIYTEIEGGNPRYVCTDCSNCTSTFGTSLCSIKNRGCCFYFPEFTLLDIQRMVKTTEGLTILDMILSHPGTSIQPYCIQTKGFFDESLYNDYKKKGNLPKLDNINDFTIFFRVCPFVKSGYGCTIPPRYRNIVCNTFVCEELYNSADASEASKLYMDERYKYARWVNWENTNLKYLLMENNANLVSDFNRSIQILQEAPLSEYQFPHLKPLITKCCDNLYSDETNLIAG